VLCAKSVRWATAVPTVGLAPVAAPVGAVVVVFQSNLAVVGFKETVVAAIGTPEHIDCVAATVATGNAVTATVAEPFALTQLLIVAVTSYKPASEEVMLVLLAVLVAVVDVPCLVTQVHVAVPGVVVAAVKVIFVPAQYAKDVFGVKLEVIVGVAGVGLTVSFTHWV
jgi:hypothetical protein